jgi:hypothetical protein
VKTCTAANLADERDSGYRHGTNHAGPMTDAIISANDHYTNAHEAAPQAHLDRGGLDGD